MGGHQAMKRVFFSILLLAVISACGPDPDEIVNSENKKLADLQNIENVKVEEAMAQIRKESEIIAKGGVLPTKADTAAPAQPTPAAADPAPTTQKPAAQTASIPHHIQVGAFTTLDGAKTQSEAWKSNGFSNVTYFENPNATTIYKFVVRLTGYDGYSAALNESERINKQYGIRSYPIQAR